MGKKSEPGKGSNIDALSVLIKLFLGIFLLLSVRLCVHPWFHFRVHPYGNRKKIAASVPSQGVVLEWNRFAALYDGATGGDERRHIASARHRGSEGALAISLNPLRTPLSCQVQRFTKPCNAATASPPEKMASNRRTRTMPSPYPAQTGLP
jgi:hypothetical protein